MAMRKEKSNLAYVGVGSNLDNSIQQVLKAIEIVNQHESCVVKQTSSLYRTDPLGFEEQPEFINAAFNMTTDLDPIELLDILLSCEKDLGRVRTGQVNGPRRIDLDLLLYEQQMIQSATLVVPHPRMHERRFVLQPLLEIDPEIEIPNRGRAIDLLESCKHQQVVKI